MAESVKLAEARKTHAQWLADGKPYSNLWIDSADAAFERIAVLEAALRRAATWFDMLSVNRDTHHVEPRTAAEYCLATLTHKDGA